MPMLKKSVAALMVLVLFVSFSSSAFAHGINKTEVRLKEGGVVFYMDSNTVSNFLSSASGSGFISQYIKSSGMLVGTPAAPFVGVIAFGLAAYKWTINRISDGGRYGIRAIVTFPLPVVIIQRQ